MFGKRELKYDFFLNNYFTSIDFEKIKIVEPYFFFVQSKTNYMFEKGILVSEIFNKQSMGVTTARDHFVIDFDKSKLLLKIEDFSNLKIVN